MYPQTELTIAVKPVYVLGRDPVGSRDPLTRVAHVDPLTPMMTP